MNDGKMRNQRPPADSLAIGPVPAFAIPSSDSCIYYYFLKPCKIYYYLKPYYYFLKLCKTL